MKTCSKCSILQPLNNFYKRKEVGRLQNRRTICKNCVAKYMAINTERYKKQKQQFRIEVLSHYCGGKKPFCQCCGETEIKFLCLDHINNDGNKHRKEIGNNVQIAYWLKKNNYPKTIQVLCYNCNMSKGFWGECPHSILKN